MSHVSLITSSSFSSSRKAFRTSRLVSNPRAPRPSAASWRHIASCSVFFTTSSKYETASGLRVWPKQYASSCFSKAEDDVKPAAIAWIAGNVFSVGGCKQAMYFRENRARNRRASGSDSLTRTLRRVRMVSSTPSGWSTAEEAIVYLVCIYSR